MARADKNMEEQAKYQTKMDKMDKMDAVNDGIKPVNEEAPRTRMSRRYSTRG